MKDFEFLRFQIASDLQRDGLGMEMVDSNDRVIAEVFRSDRHKTLTLSLFVEPLPFKAVKHLMEKARAELDPFEDGTPLSDAVN